MFAVIDSCLIEACQIIAVALPLIGCEQTDFVGNDLVHEIQNRLRVHFSETRTITLPLRCTAPMIGTFVKYGIIAEFRCAQPDYKPAATTTFSFVPDSGFSAASFRPC